MENHKNLIVWQKADRLAFEIYKATEHFPRNEMFGITSQIRRSALSVPVNIVEGYGRKSKQNFLIL
jgi:four helix bundle protein